MPKSIMFVMKLSFSIFLIFYSIISFSQVEISGEVVDYKYSEPIESASVILFQMDSAIQVTYTDSLGKFHFADLQKEDYLIKTVLLFGENLTEINVQSDTSIVIKIEQPLAFESPCRKTLQKNNYILNLPLDTLEIEEIRNRTLGLKELIDQEEPQIMRIWNLPAFGYMSGTMYEFSSNVNGLWKLIKYEFESNHSELMDSLHKANCIYSDSLYYELLDYTIVSQNQIVSPNGWKEFENKNFIGRILSSKDYCEDITKSDMYCCMDGISYDLEVKSENLYKFIYFSNPQEYPGKYEQVDAFLELLFYLNNEFK